MNKKSIIFAIDFDGTCVTHDFPDIGEDIGSVSVLKQLLENGHELILFTMRSGISLTKAVDWFTQNDIRLYGVQYNPTQAGWTASNKCYAQIYIDDAALGCPLKFDTNLSDKPFVDWDEVRKILKNKNII